MSIDVLIVDDSLTIRAMIKKALQLSLPDLGQVYEAENGILALARLAEKEVGLIMTDLNMPRMNGLQLIEKIKRQPKYANIPVIVVSTDGSTERLSELEQQGIRGYLRKPFRPEQLKQVLSEILETSYDHQTNNANDCDF
jgi:two-component system, chemotaxis family, chemotaxis protein CheY